MDGSLLASLAAAGHLRRGTVAAARGTPPLASGYPLLDAVLGGGWPLGQLLEILALPAGGAELALLLPGLARLAQADVATPPRPVIFVAPPHLPYPPACAQHGLDPQRLLVVDPQGGEAAADRVAARLWAMEECLAADASLAVLAWAGRVPALALRRLQLAALTGRSLAVLVRGAGARRERSPAPVRLAIQPAPAGLAVEVLRNRFGATGCVELALG